MYVHQVKSNVIQPIESLRGFQRVALEPGETKRVTIALPATQLSYFDVCSRSLLLLRGCST
jgi:beta-glucosidase